MIAMIATLVLLAYATALWLGVYPGERAIARVQRRLRSARRPLGSAPARRWIPSPGRRRERLRSLRVRTRGPPAPAPTTTPV